jgi:hypothetical protein
VEEAIPECFLQYLPSKDALQGWMDGWMD